MRWKIVSPRHLLNSLKRVTSLKSECGLPHRSSSTRRQQIRKLWTASQITGENQIRTYQLAAVVENAGCVVAWKLSRCQRWQLQRLVIKAALILTKGALGGD